MRYMIVLLDTAGRVVGAACLQGDLHYGYAKIFPDVPRGLSHCRITHVLILYAYSRPLGPPVQVKALSVFPGQMVAVRLAARTPTVTTRTVPVPAPHLLAAAAFARAWVDGLRALGLCP